MVTFFSEYWVTVVVFATNVLVLGALARYFYGEVFVKKLTLNKIFNDRIVKERSSAYREGREFLEHTNRTLEERIKLLERTLRDRGIPIPYYRW